MAIVKGTDKIKKKARVKPKITTSIDHTPMINPTRVARFDITLLRQKLGMQSLEKRTRIEEKWDKKYNIGNKSDDAIHPYPYSLNR